MRDRVQILEVNGCIYSDNKTHFVGYIELNFVRRRKRTWNPKTLSMG